MNGVDQDIDDEASKRRKMLARLAYLAYQVGCMGYIGNHSLKLVKQPYRIPQQTGYEWVMECLGHERSCYKMFRMNRDFFRSLHNVLVSHYGLESSREVTSVEALGMFLWIVGGPKSFSQVENRFERSTETIHRKFKEVLHCLCKLAHHNITPRDPSFKTVHARIQEDPFWPHFKGARAIDGCHIPVEVSAEEIVNLTGRHGFPSQNVLAVCDFDMRFTFVVAGWPGSAHDTRILNDTLAKYAHRLLSLLKENITLLIRVIQIAKDILLLTKAKYTICQNSVMDGNLLGSMRPSTMPTLEGEIVLNVDLGCSRLNFI